MGRIGDLFGEITVAAEEGPEGLQLPPDAWERLRADWSDEDIEEAMGFVQASLVHDELVEAADSVSAHLVELLGRWGESRGWKEAVAGRATLSVEAIRQVVHRLDHLEEVLDACREQKGPDRRGFDRLQRRLMDLGIEDDMSPPARGEESE
jgi:hypothetical protein